MSFKMSLNSLEYFIKNDLTIIYIETMGIFIYVYKLNDMHGCYNAC